MRSNKNQNDKSKFKMGSPAGEHHNFAFCVLRFELKKGISLIEAVVYVALLGMISVFVANSLISIASVYWRARAEREVLSNARSVLDLVTKAVAQSQEVYGPTSRLNADLGQLSLVTGATSTPGHTTAYVDFWIDNGLVMMRQEGEGAITLSAASVRVTQLRFERLAQALGRESVKTVIRVDFASPKFPTSATLNATTALRGNY